MNPKTLERAASVAAIAMALLLVLLQFVFTPDRRAPTFLFVTFTTVWIFGAVMLLVAPRFGAAGTALYGLLSAWGAWSMHRLFRPEDVALIGGSLAAAAVAAAALVVRIRTQD